MLLCIEFHTNDYILFNHLSEFPISMTRSNFGLWERPSSFVTLVFDLPFLVYNYYFMRDSMLATVAVLFRLVTTTKLQSLVLSPYKKV